MNPFVDSQVRSLVENIRLLEVFVTAPLGLHSDIKMLRESLALPEAADLSRDELRQRRLAFTGMSADSRMVALEAIDLVRTSVGLLNDLRAGDGVPFSPEWAERAGRVLQRVEQKVGSDLRRETASKVQGLYVIVDPQVTNGRPVGEVAQAAIAGGASVIQLRDKVGDSGDVLPLAREIRSACEQAGALFIMNDDAALTVASGAHGLHLGQTDMPVPDARSFILPTQIVGSSNNSIEEVVESQAAGVDYLAVGAVFPTSTMGKAARASVGAETIARVKDMVDQPVVAIGGINESNVAEVAATGADAACVVSAVTLAEDPEAAARKMVERMRG